MITYEIWNTDTRNIVGAFATEAEALTLVNDAIESHGADYADTLALVVDDGDEIESLAVGSELASLARSTLAVVSAAGSRD